MSMRVRNSDFVEEEEAGPPVLLTAISFDISGGIGAVISFDEKKGLGGRRS